jgi:hypothetical protein
LPTMVREAGLKPAGSVTTDTPHGLVWLPLRGRSRASCAPTAFGPNQKLRGQALLQRSAIDLPQLRFCPEGVGVRLADDGARSGPQTLKAWRLLIYRRGWFGCRCAADREQAALLRPSARIKSFVGKPCSDGTRLIHQIAATPLLPGGRRSPACRRWCAKRTSNLPAR